MALGSGLSRAAAIVPTSALLVNTNSGLSCLAAPAANPTARGAGRPQPPCLIATSATEPSALSGAQQKEQKS